MIFRNIQRQLRPGNHDGIDVPNYPIWLLWIAGYAILACGICLAWNYSLFTHGTELADLWQIAGNGVTAFSVWASTFAVMFGAWIAAIVLLRGRTIGDLWMPVVGISLLNFCAFLFVYPGTAIDVFIYAARSHLLTDYGLNPSTVTPDRYWDTDPFVRYASAEWSTGVSPYGPLWNLIAAPVTAFDGNDIFNALVLFKVIHIAAIAVIGVLIHQIVRIHRPNLAVSAAVAWLWCPVVLWEGIANSHNDVILLLPVLAALWCWYRGHLGWVAPLIAVSALIKIVTLMFLPVAIIAIIRRVGINRQLGKIVGMTIFLSLGAVWIAFAPFYDIRGVIDAVQSQRGIWVTSPPLLVVRWTEAQGWGFDIGVWYEEFSTLVIIAATVIGMVVAWKRPDLLPRIAFEQFFWFLLLATTNLRPWYGIWLIAIVLILPPGFTWLRAGAWVLGGLYSYAVGGWVIPWLEVGSPWSDTIVLATSLGPVLVITLWWGLRSLTSLRDERRPEFSRSTAEPTAG
jgi:hypothetical protein